MTNEVFENIRCQEATWADLGPIWVPKRLRNGPGGGSKHELSSVKLRCVKLSEVEVSLECEKKRWSVALAVWSKAGGRGKGRQ